MDTKIENDDSRHQHASDDDSRQGRACDSAASAAAAHRDGAEQRGDARHVSDQPALMQPMFQALGMFPGHCR